MSQSTIPTKEKIQMDSDRLKDIILDNNKIEWYDIREWVIDEH